MALMYFVRFFFQDAPILQKKACLEWEEIYAQLQKFLRQGARYCLKRGILSNIVAEKYFISGQNSYKFKLFIDVWQIKHTIHERVTQHMWNISTIGVPTVNIWAFDWGELFDHLRSHGGYRFWWTCRCSICMRSTWLQIHIERRSFI